MDESEHHIAEVTLLRRELDRQYAARLAHVEAQLTALEKQVNEDLAAVMTALQSLTLDLRTLVARQTDHEPTMQALERIVGAGMVLRWIVIFVVGALAAIGTTATAWDSLQKWLR